MTLERALKILADDRRSASAASNRSWEILGSNLEAGEERRSRSTTSSGSELMRVEKWKAVSQAVEMQNREARGSTTPKLESGSDSSLATTETERFKIHAIDLAAGVEESEDADMDME